MTTAKHCWSSSCDARALEGGRHGLEVGAPSPRHLRSTSCGVRSRSRCGRGARGQPEVNLGTPTTASPRGAASSDSAAGAVRDARDSPRCAPRSATAAMSARSARAQPRFGVASDRPTDVRRESPGQTNTWRASRFRPLCQLLTRSSPGDEAPARGATSPTSSVPPPQNRNPSPPRSRLLAVSRTSPRLITRSDRAGTFAAQTLLKTRSADQRLRASGYYHAFLDADVHPATSCAIRRRSARGGRSAGVERSSAAMTSAPCASARGWRRALLLLGWPCFGERSVGACDLIPIVAPSPGVDAFSRSLATAHRRVEALVISSTPRAC